MIDGEIENALKKIVGNLKTFVPLSEYTTFKTGGSAKYLAEAESEEELKNLHKYIKEKNIPHFLLGYGSNTLAKDDGFDGVIIKLSGEFKKISHEETKLSCGGGVFLPALQAYATKNSLSGLEPLSGIPGSVGGAVVINAATKFGSISDAMESVRTLEEDLNYKTLKKKEIVFSYRNSSLKNNIVVGATFAMTPKRPEEILKKINNYMVHRSVTQPLKPSAGSIFKNPPGHFAGKLIEGCGLKGKKIGGAMISEEHANFIINNGNAKSEDILELIDMARKKVKEEFGINLELEIKIL